jgi:uncharacterized protein YbjQ (UPF0145 family)
MRVDATFGLPRDNAGKGGRMRTYRIAVAVALTACVGLSAGEAAAKGKRVFVVVNETAGVPVFAGDIPNRPYRVIGEVSAGVRKATLFSKASSEAKIFRELWERADKMGADAVINARFGKSHVTAVSWGKTNATGTAIKFEGAATP